MTDSKLRELERVWKETGSVEDEARYLQERVRVGELDQERLELAAYCGHEGARRATGQTTVPGSLEEAIGAATGHANPQLTIVAAAVALLSAAFSLAAPEDPFLLEAEAVLRATENWLAAPSGAGQKFIRVLPTKRLIHATYSDTLGSAAVTCLVLVTEFEDPASAARRISEEVERLPNEIALRALPRLARWALCGRDG